MTLGALRDQLEMIRYIKEKEGYQLIKYSFRNETCGNDSELEFSHHSHFPIVTAHKVPGYLTINLLLYY